MLRVKQVVEQYHVCKMTVYRWIKAGLPIIKFGGITFIDEKELEKFIRGGK